jgi:hypothetical protein
LKADNTIASERNKHSRKASDAINTPVAHESALDEMARRKMAQAWRGRMKVKGGTRTMRRGG